MINNESLSIHPQKQLDDFRNLYPAKTLIMNDNEWCYHMSEVDKPVLVLLPGGMGTGEGFFMHFLHLRQRFTVITISYASATTFQQVTDAVLAILDKEDIDCFHMLGQSFGGLVAQQLLHLIPHRVQQVILSHTSSYAKTADPAISKNRIKRLKKLRLIMPLIPKQLLAKLTAKVVDRHLDQLDENEKLFWCEYFITEIQKRSTSYLRAMYACMINYCQHIRHPVWEGTSLANRMLIIESAEDRSISKEERRMLLDNYPSATVHSFPEGGHLSLLVNREQYLAIVENFLLAEG